MAGNDGAVAPDKHYGVVVGVVALTSVASGGVLAFALAELNQLGFAPKAIRVCSGSVGEGEVRQVLLVAEGVSTPIVGLEGVDPAHERLPGGSQLLVKVGTGQPCP